ncbi:MAG: exodeoxyribonuclease VII large subunit [Armatimonadota bacterium]|nr:exodeoxyribonuclease VII large subunit [Armatimonadota bacterium]MDW8143311.1 exodeoxyribonuclease VII large subunit [Armatimonadota bacterium]
MDLWFESIEESWLEFVRRIEREDWQKEPVFTVTDINNYLRQMVSNDDFLQRVWVKGEISRWQVYQSGHAYFTLKDEQSQITGVMWRERRAALKEEPKEGERVRVLGSIRVSKRGGEFQIDAIAIVREIDKGYWWQRFEETKRKLEAEGLFDSERKRELPPFPRRIGVITSPDGAAIRDIIRIARERHSGVEIILFPSLVQGEDAPDSLAKAINLANSEEVERIVGKIDVLIIGRGGGSIEDLWAFNEEIVVRAVAKSQIPTVSAVGHEVDFTLTDFAADVRAPTPTAAAQMVVPDRQELLDRLKQLEIRLRQAIKSRLRQAREQWRRLSERRCFIDPMSLLSDFRQDIDRIGVRLESLGRNSLAEKRRQLLELSNRLAHRSPHAQLAQWRERLHRYGDALRSLTEFSMSRNRRNLELLENKLEALNPFAVLQRGYALVRDPISGQVLTRVAHFSEGQQAEVILADGKLKVTVDEVVKGDEVFDGANS